MYVVLGSSYMSKTFSRGTQVTSEHGTIKQIILEDMVY